MSDGMGHLMRFLVLLCLLVTTGCAAAPKQFNGAESPLIYDAAAVARADRVVVLIPGALASVRIFAPTDRWVDDGYALVYYRFPGLDDLPLDHTLGIENAAQQIADFAVRYPDKSFRLLGYSTGGPIAILAAERMGDAVDVKVAAMSSAVERAGGIQTAVQGGLDLAAAVIAAQSLHQEKIVKEYYRTLLFGRRGLRDPARIRDADDIVGGDDKRIVLPEGAMPRAHTRDLRRWTLDDMPRLPAGRLRFFVGLEDSVFSTGQTQRFARNFGDVTILGYPEQGHLLFLTRPDVFNDIKAFFEE
jgi:pimeloyl-ACP methyl ester carboxylesterase